MLAILSSVNMAILRESLWMVKSHGGSSLFGFYGRSISTITYRETGAVQLGKTDELGFAAVEDRVSVPDWHATLLHLLGLHHEKLFLNRNGLNERLTGVTQPRIIREILS